MKKILLSMMAATMIFATSCENELELGAAGEEAMVSFTIATPDMGSRATEYDYSDGTTATVLQYAVYNAAGEELTDLTVTDGEIHGSTTVKLQLTTGNTYSVIFWAAAPNAPYTVDFAEKTMKVNYQGALSNDENRDAFYAFKEIKVTGAQTETIELKRPFAQLNIGTNDYAASTSAGYTPTQSAVTVKQVYTTLNLMDGNVDEKTKVDAVFAESAIDRNQTFPVANCEYIAMNYLLVDDEKETVDVEFTYTDGTNAKTRKVGSVPVQRNYRTNIYGQLLTSDVDVNVEIKPEYNEPAHEAEALFLAAAVGGEVTLTGDVVLTAPLEVQANMVLNLANNKLAGSINVADGVELTVNNGTIENTNKENSGIESTGKLTLNNVEITSARHAVRIEGGEAVINGGTYKVAPAAGTKMTVHALNVSGKSNVTIKGGTFVGAKGTNADSGSAVNVQSGASVTIEGGYFSGGKNKTLACGGTLIVKGGSFDQDPATYIAAGFKAIEKGGKYYVVADEIDAVATTAADLATALADGKNVTLGNDITVAATEGGYTKAGILQNKAQTIDGGGHTLTVTGAGATWDCAIYTNGGTIRNLTVAGAFRGIFTAGQSSDLYIENVVFKDVIYTFHSDGDMPANPFGVYVSNSTVNGWTSHSDMHTEVVYTKCSFGKGSGYAYCRPYGKTAFINCTFSAGYSIDKSQTTDITFTDCTFEK